MDAANLPKGALTPEMITKLMAGSRTRNQYGPKLLEFETSDTPAVNVADTWPTDFGAKEPATLYQGFINAAKKANMLDKVQIIRREDDVFLLHKERVQLVLAEQNGNDNHATDDDTED